MRVNVHIYFQIIECGITAVSAGHGGMPLSMKYI